MLTRSAGPAAAAAGAATPIIDISLSPSPTTSTSQLAPPAARDSLSFDAPEDARPARQVQQIQLDSEEDEEEEEEDEILLATLPTLSKQQVEREVLTIDDEDEQRVEAGDARFGEVLLPKGADSGHGDGERNEQSEQDQQRRADWAKQWQVQGAGRDEPEGDSMDEDEEEEEEEEEEEDEDAEMSDSKSEGEQEAIQYEMARLTENVPALIGSYKLVDRLGEGTFSSVYKAIDLKHSQYDNEVWAPSSIDPVTGMPVPKAGKVYVALKRIYVTSSPIRIQNELDILNDLRGTNNVAYLIAALRHEDQVIAIMPFNRHQDFRTYYRTSSLPLLRSYFASLFRALASTHSQQIIHRDVKPANFLYDVTTGLGVLCDYGLAQKIGGDEWYEWKSDCCHSLPGPSWGGLEGRVKSQRKQERLQPGTPPGLASGLHGVRLGRPLSLYEQSSKQEHEYRSLSRRLEAQLASSRTDPSIPPPSAEEVEEVRRMKPWIMPEGWRDDLKARWRERQGFLKGWRPATMVQSQGMAGQQGERIGYLKEDRRPSVRANRAGTRGFRAPEVLLKCPDQTVSLDIWSAGIVLLCFLTRRFPFFNSNDDTEALAEIAAIFGKRKMERCAALHNRTFITNIPTFDAPPHPTLHALVKALNPPIFTESSPDPYGPIPSSEESDREWYEGSELSQAVDLMRRCLELDCTKRWTAEECLEHPFFNGMYDVGMGVLAPRGEQYISNCVGLYASLLVQLSTSTRAIIHAYPPSTPSSASASVSASAPLLPISTSPSSSPRLSHTSTFSASEGGGGSGSPSRARSSSPPPAISSSGGRPRSSSFHEPPVAATPLIFLQQLTARFKRRPLPFVLASLALVCGTLLLVRSASHGVAAAAAREGKHVRRKQGGRIKEVRQRKAPQTPWAVGEGFVLDKREDGEYQHPTKEDLRTFVGPNPKFLVKDNWAAYGYNNVRYMFEATLNMAQIVGRIPVIPDSAWARTCAVESEICTKHALEYFEHRKEHSEMGPKIWNEEGEAWKLGIEHFLDIPHLRRTYGPFLTLSEFFTLYSLDPSLIDYSGTWNATAYTPKGLTSESFIRDEFEFDIDFVRVDRPLKDSNYYPLPDVEGLNHNVVMETRGWRHVWSMETARMALGKLGIKLPQDETTLIAAMDKMGQAPLFTFHDDLLMSKALALPVVDLVQRNRIRTLTGQLGGEPFGSASIVYLPGDLHDQRKPGGLRFTSAEARKGFVDMVLKGVRPPRRYTALGEVLAGRMSEKVGGRRWVGAHMRRGDFLGIDWSPDTSARGHLNKTRIALAAGVQVMATREADRLPLPGDPFYLATDEEDSRALSHYRSHGAILLSDLLLPSDAKSLGWQSSFVDLLALVEQEILANADFFVGSKMSSTTGGIVNLREARRQPSWSWSLLGREVEAD